MLRSCIATVVEVKVDEFCILFSRAIGCRDSYLPLCRSVVIALLGESMIVFCIVALISAQVLRAVHAC